MMKRRNLIRVWSMLALVLMASAWCAQTVQAVPLADGGAVILGGTTVAARPELAGTVIYNDLRPVSIGAVQNAVVRSDMTGMLDFYYRIIPNPEFGDPNGFIFGVTSGNFGSFNPDVDFRTDGEGEIAPTSAFRNGDFISFVFDNPPVTLGPSSSFFFFISTNATEFDLNGVSVINFDFNQAIINTAQPTVPIPEPATLSLVGLSLAGIGFLRRRRAQSAKV